MVPAVVSDQGHQLLVQGGFRPGHVGALLAHPGRDAVHADGLGVIEKNHCVRGPEADLYGAAVVAVQDPLLAPQQFSERSIKGLPADMGAVRPPPEVVEMHQRQPRPRRQGSGQGALPAAGAAQDQDAVADSLCLHCSSFDRDGRFVNRPYGSTRKSRYGIVGADHDRPAHALSQFRGVFTMTRSPGASKPNLR